jgi:sulfite exporter TauE/SafE
MLWSALLLGIIGSLHCAGMCGPIALAIPLKGKSSSFFSGAFLYNIGRIFTYAVMGAMVGGLGKTFVAISGAANIFSITAGILLLLFATGFLSFTKVGFTTARNPVYGFVKRKIGFLLSGNHRYNSSLIGIMNGFLPCGMVYAALASASVSGSATEGSLFMILFGLGTFPMMLTITLSRKTIPLKFRSSVTRLFPYITMLIALLLILRGMNLDIPFISPAFKSGNGGCTMCH